MTTPLAGYRRSSEIEPFSGVDESQVDLGFELPNSFQTERAHIFASVGAQDFDIFVAAVEIAVENQRFSNSMLERRLLISAERAQHIADLLESQGVIGPKTRIRPRQVLIAAEDLPLLLFVLRGEGSVSEVA